MQLICTVHLAICGPNHISTIVAHFKTFNILGSLVKLGSYASFKFTGNDGY